MRIPIYLNRPPRKKSNYKNWNAHINKNNKKDEKIQWIINSSLTAEIKMNIWSNTQVSNDIVCIDWIARSWENNKALFFCLLLPSSQWDANITNKKKTKNAYEKNARSNFFNFQIPPEIESNVQTTKLKTKYLIKHIHYYSYKNKYSFAGSSVVTNQALFLRYLLTNTYVYTSVECHVKGDW